MRRESHSISVIRALSSTRRGERDGECDATTRGSLARRAAPARVVRTCYPLRSSRRNYPSSQPRRADASLSAGELRWYTASLSCSCQRYSAVGVLLSIAECTRAPFTPFSISRWLSSLSLSLFHPFSLWYTAELACDHEVVRKVLRAGLGIRSAVKGDEEDPRAEKHWPTEGDAEGPGYWLMDNVDLSWLLVSLDSMIERFAVGRWIIRAQLCD